MPVTPLKPQDNVLQRPVTAAMDSGDPNLQMLQRLDIIILLLREGLNVRDENTTLLGQPLSQLQQP